MESNQSTLRNVNTNSVIGAVSMRKTIPTAQTMGFLADKDCIQRQLYIILAKDLICSCSSSSDKSVIIEITPFSNLILK